MACVFNKQLLHPRNWLTWFGLGILWLIVQLPYPLLHFIGTSAGRLSRRFLKRREHIARRNIELCFPEMSPAARETLIDQNFMSLGMGLIETGMAWFWSDERVKKWFDVEGMVNLNNALSEQKGVMVVGVHFMSLELGGRTMGLCRPMMATYRPHNSPLMEWVQTRGRLRSNKAMIDRRNLSGLVHALKSGEAVWFAPDQDYGAQRSIFVPLFGVPAATVTATSKFARMGRAQVIPFTQQRLANGQGYRVQIHPPLRDFPTDNEEADCLRINQWVEQAINACPEQYLWAHRRFKTRPQGEPKLYKKKR